MRADADEKGRERSAVFDGLFAVFFTVENFEFVGIGDVLEYPMELAEGSFVFEVALTGVESQTQ